MLTSPSLSGLLIFDFVISVVMGPVPFLMASEFNFWLSVLPTSLSSFELFSEVPLDLL